MLLVHYLIFASLIGRQDIREHRISRSRNYLAIVTLIPLAGMGSIRFAILNVLLYLLIRVLSCRGLGKGDVRLSPLMGMYVATYSSELSDLIVLNVITWITAAAVLLTLIALRRINKTERIAFAPFMFCGVLIHAYINLVIKNCSLSAIIAQCVG